MARAEEAEAEPRGGRENRQNYLITTRFPFTSSLSRVSLLESDILAIQQLQGERDQSVAKTEVESVPKD